MEEKVWNFQREKDFWITGNREYRFAKMKLDIGNMELHIKGERLTICNPDHIEIILNGLPIKVTHRL